GDLRVPRRGPAPLLQRRVRPRPLPPAARRDRRERPARGLLPRRRPRSRPRGTRGAHRAAPLPPRTRHRAQAGRGARKGPRGAPPGGLRGAGRAGRGEQARGRGGGGLEARRRERPVVPSVGAERPQRKASMRAKGKDKAKDSGDGKMKAKKYAKELRKLQSELCRLQDWVKYRGLRIIVVFEGRDAAGKGGTIRAITERVSPRVFRLV